MIAIHFSMFQGLQFTPYALSVLLFVHLQLRGNALHKASTAQTWNLTLLAGWLFVTAAIGAGWQVCQHLSEHIRPSLGFY